MKTNTKRILFLPVFLVCVLLISYFAHRYYRNKEYDQQVNFFVAKVKTTNALKLGLYNKKGEQFSMNSFVLYEYYKIMQGDSLSKKAGSGTLKIYRKASNGKFCLFLEVQQK